MPKITKFPGIFFIFTLMPPHARYEDVFTSLNMSNEYARMFDIYSEEQFIEQENTLFYAEKFLQEQDLTKITPEALEHFICELHRLTAYTIQMSNQMGYPSGEYVNYRILLASTNVDSETYYPSV